MAFDKNGTLYFLFVGLHTSGNVPMGAFLATSSNQGRTFSAPQRVLGPRNFGVRMAIDPTLGEPVRIHFVWLHSGTEPGLGSFPAGRNPILSAYSDDGGNSLSEPVQVSDPRRARVVAPALALGPDRAVHIAYYDLQGDARDYQGLAGPVWEGTWSVVATTSTDGGRSFGPSLSVDEQVVPSERPILIFTMPPPALAAGRRGVCAAWTDSRHGDPDILARCSDDAGRHWDALQRVNDDPVGNGATQYLPRLSAAPDGRLDAVFLDRRYDPLNTDNDVSYTHSFDGGRTFAPVSRISSSSWSPRIGPEYAGPAARGKVEIGSRLGLLSGRAGVVAAWADTRYPVGRRPRGQSIYSRSLELSPPTGASWRQPLGVVVLLAGVAALGGAVRRDPDDGGDR